MMMEALGWLYGVALFWPVGVAALFLADWLGVTRIVSMIHVLNRSPGLSLF